MPMITDTPFNPKDRSQEVWIEVDAKRAAAAYRKGLADITTSMPAIVSAAIAVFGEEVQPTPYSDLKRLKRDIHVKHAKRIQAACNHMEKVMSAGTGQARMPFSEVQAMLDLEDNRTLNWLLNPIN